MVCGKCVGLPPGAVEREHELTPQAFPHGVLPHERFQLGDDLRVAAEGKLAISQIHQRAQPLLLQLRDLVARERLEEHIGEGGPAPERERLAVGTPSPLELVARRKPPPLRHELAETRRIDGVLVDSQKIAGRARLDRLGTKLAAELRDVGLNELRRRRRRSFAPQLVDQAFARDDLVRMEQQHP